MAPCNNELTDKFEKLIFSLRINILTPQIGVHNSLNFWSAETAI